MKNNRNSFLNATVGILKLPSVAFFLFKSVRKQKRFIKAHLLPDLNTFKDNNDGSLREADFKKITN